MVNVMFGKYRTFKTLVIGLVMFCTVPEFAVFASCTVAGYYLIGLACDEFGIK
jgi:hypothetical protein